MPIVRDHFQRKFTAFPAWGCSTCTKGSLVEDKTRRLLLEPQWSAEAHDHDAWEPEWITYRFVAILTCNNPACGEYVCLVGNAAPWEFPDDEYGSAYEERLEPLEANPPISIFEINEDWPESVRNQLKLAFSHVWNDPGASANRLRTAAECLLDDRGVAKFPRTGKRRKIDLHRRIQLFKPQNPEAADLLLAVKWLGNAGSHADVTGLTRDDLLTGMELLERALHLIYDKTAKRLARLAKQINKQKGPKRPRRRRLPPIV